jgi:subfamily B ATP-binding cassette protein MsbA
VRGATRAARRLSKDKARGLNLAQLRAMLPEVWALMRPRRRLLALACVLMALSRSAGLVLPLSTRFFVDDVIGRGRVELMTPLVLGVLAATVVQGLSAYALVQLVSKAAQKLIAEMRIKVQEHVGRLGVAFHDQNRAGDLVSRIMNDVDGFRNLIGTGLVELAGGLVTATLAFAYMLYLSRPVTALTFLSIGAFAIVVYRAVKLLGPTFRERSELYAQTMGRLTESLSGVRVVKAYQAEDREAAVFSGGVQRILDNVYRTLASTSALSLASTLLLGVVGAGLLFAGSREILAGRLTLGSFFTYTVLLGFVVAPLVQVATIGAQLSEALAGLQRTRELLAAKREDDDPRRTVELEGLLGRVEFDQVGFAYREGEPVLQDVSLVAEPGTVTALVGPSGAGKSTIIGLACAFHAPSQGRVLVDGTDLVTVKLDSYRRHLGVVLQETFLFDGTIRDNVAFSRPEASDEEVREACRIAHVGEFAEGFKDGYDTVVGERGVRLSGGQRQRVAIARAILADPKILILDEATSSLDSESEALIQEGLGWLMKGRTTFVIAHRLSTIRRADQILVVEKGRIVERGSHADLHALGGRYREMYDRQLGVEANLFLAPGENVEPEEPAPADAAAEPAAAGGAASRARATLSQIDP